jgi:hypothetical protein
MDVAALVPVFAEPDETGLAVVEVARAKSRRSCWSNSGRSRCSCCPRSSDADLLSDDARLYSG